ncbi:MAG: transcription termination/antitermination protein NusG [Anaerolineae bacterium]|nr:transcription termination/antitermination protein NusG [Anaerolineae bacterium]
MTDEQKDIFMSSNPDGDADIPEASEQDYDPDPFTIEAADSDDDFNIVLDDGVDKGAKDADANKYWYVIHCYSGYENKVHRAIMQRIDTMGMKDSIFDVLIPTEEEIEVKDGKRRTVERRVFPGYILVQMKLDEDSWYVVRNTPGVTGFVGMGNEPTPLRPEEVKKIMNRMESDEEIYKIDFKLGDQVRITGGPFNDFIGNVSGIDMDKQKVRVMVDFFGRETPVELDFLEVSKD